MKDKTAANLSDWSYAQKQSVNSNAHKVNDNIATLLSVENGILVISSSSVDSYAELVTPSDSRISVIVNGQFVNGSVLISAKDTVGIKTFHKEPKIWLSSEVSADKYSVMVSVHIVPGTMVSLADALQNHRLALQLKEQPLPPQALKPEVIYDFIEKMRVYGNLDEAAIHRLSKATEPTSEIVLRGSPPELGEPTKIKLNVSPEIDDENRTVCLPIVPSGMELGTFVEPIPGKAGITVYDELVVPRYLITFPLLGVGVENHEGNLISTRTGRLMVNKNLIDVVPELVIEHDVDATDGPIHFDGNVVIHGSVTERASIRAGGLVIVSKNVTRSNIFSDRGVIVRGNVTSSNITSGMGHLVYTKIAKQIDELLFDLKVFQEDYASLFAAIANRKDLDRVFTMIPKALFEKKYSRLKLQLESFVTDCPEDACYFDDVLKGVLLYIKLKWIGSHIYSVTGTDITHLIERLTEYRARKIVSTTDNFAFIRVASLTRTRLFATGTIFVNGAGAFVSSLESGRHIAILGRARGGFIVAKRSVRIKELGSDHGVETSVRVIDPNGLIFVDIRHINTLIDIDGKRDRSVNTEYKLRFRGGIGENADATCR